MKDISKELMDLIFTSLDHGINSVRDGGPLVPFLMAKMGDEVKLMRVVPKEESNVEDQVNLILKQIYPVSDYVTAVFESFVTLDDTRTDAILVKGYAKDSPKVHLFGQRFAPKKLLRKFKTIGNPGYMGEEVNRFIEE